MLHILDFDSNSNVRDDVDDDVVVVIMVLMLKASVYLISSRTLMAQTRQDHQKTFDRLVGRAIEDQLCKINLCVL